LCTEANWKTIINSFDLILTDMIAFDFHQTVFIHSRIKINCRGTLKGGSKKIVALINFLSRRRCQANYTVITGRSMMQRRVMKMLFVLPLPSNFSNVIQRHVRSERTKTEGVISGLSNSTKAAVRDQRI
jgi:hypothetical protein